MSHTTEINKTIFIHNGDYSGDVEIKAGLTGRGLSVTIPFDDLKEFIAEYIRDNRVLELEQMTNDQLLKIGSL